METISKTLGNAKEALVASVSPQPANEEPLSGATGKGTLDSPYDQGNESENQEVPRIDVSSGQTRDQPVNPESNSSPGAPKLPSPNDPLASPTTTHQGSGDPMASPTAAQEQVIHETRGRDETAQRTTSTMLSPTGAEQKSTGTAAQGGNFDAAKPGAGQEANRLRLERSVSPGQLPDGTHVRCSGDRGESYTPGQKLTEKFKDRFHFGHKK